MINLPHAVSRYLLYQAWCKLPPSLQENLSIDEAIVPTAPLYRQLFNAFAEENATEDAIYYVGEGLRRGVIDLDVFLKQVRSLSREQFMLRATMQKCRQKAGLDPVDVK